MEDIRDRLLARAYLYDDAPAYSAGVEAALSSVTDHVGSAAVPDDQVAVGQ
ncbi:hypothetical protein BH24ACT15_BH24ACT15_07530 [soil metagenome]